MAGRPKNSEPKPKQASLLAGLKKNPTFHDDFFSIETTFSGGDKYLVLKGHATNDHISIPVEYVEVLKPIVDSEYRELKTAKNEPTALESPNHPPHGEIEEPESNKSPEEIIAELEGKAKKTKTSHVSID